MQENLLLCESCGYPIGSLESDSPCPECGRSVRGSLPSRRTGSAWQRRPGILSWFATNWAMLFRPSRVLDRLAILPRRGMGLLYLNLLVAAFLIVDPWTGVLVGDPTRAARGTDPWHELVTYAWVVSGQVGAVWCLLLALTWVEVQGVRLFARPRGWRVTKRVAWQVCAHASVGWIMAGWLVIAMLATLFILTRYFPAASGRWLTRTFVLPRVGGRVNVQEIVSALGLVAGYSGGLLWFEALVYRGVRACRFANPPEAEPHFSAARPS